MESSSFEVMKLVLNDMDRRLAAIEAKQVPGVEENESVESLPINQCRRRAKSRKGKSRSRSRRRRRH